MTRDLAIGPCALVLALGLSGCLAIQPPSAHMSPPVAADDFCTRLAQVSCDGFDRCCDDPVARAMAPDRATCVQAVQNSCTSGMYSISMAVHDPRTGYDPEHAGAVIGTYQDFVARCDPSLVVWSGRRDGFMSALRGTVDNGRPCLVDQDPVANYPALVSCRDFSQSCIVSGLRDGSCLERRPAGGNCVLDFDCQDGLYCAPRPLNWGLCTAQLANGAVCAADGASHAEWCQSSFCFMGRCAEPTQRSVYCGGGAI